MFAHFKKYFIAIFIFALVLGFLVMKPFHTIENSKNTLIVGFQSGYPPFEFMDSKGEFVGFDIDLAKLIAGKLEKTLVLKDMEFDGEILSLKQGKIDLIISGMNITPSRLKEISLIPYYGEATSSLSLIFWNTIPEGVQSLEDIAKLPNPVVSVQTGAVSDIYLDQFKDIPKKSFDGALAPLMDVKYGKSIANLVESDVVEYLQKKHPEIKVLNIPLPKEELILGFGIGVKKENQELFHQVQQIIDELKTSGELKQLEKQWFKGGEQ